METLHCAVHYPRFALAHQHFLRTFREGGSRVKTWTRLKRKKAAATRGSCNIRDSFIKIIDGPDFKLKAKRCQNVRESALKVVSWIDQHQVKADTFSEQLKKELLTILNKQAKCSLAK